jgi:hypothetical protein
VLRLRLDDELGHMDPLRRRQVTALSVGASPKLVDLVRKTLLFFGMVGTAPISGGCQVPTTEERRYGLPYRELPGPRAPSGPRCHFRRHATNEPNPPRGAICSARVLRRVHNRPVKTVGGIDFYCCSSLTQRENAIDAKPGVWPGSGPNAAGAFRRAIGSSPPGGPAIRVCKRVPSSGVV